MPSWMGPSYTMNMSRKPRALHCPCLLLVMCIALCRGTETQTDLTSLLNNVYSVIENKLVTPYCFTTTLYDLTCFWESNRSDATSYRFYYKPGVEYCRLKTVATSNGTWWHVCQFPEEYIDLFALDPYHISVKDTSEPNSFGRNCSTEEIVYMEPIENITVKKQLRPLGLFIIINDSFGNNLLDYLTFQVRYISKEGGIQRIKTFEQVPAQQSQKMLFLHEIVRGAEYSLSVRVKPDGSYDGYWSQWSEDVHVQISEVVDVLQVTLYVIAGLVPVIALILITTCKRRFLKKVWPKIPSPEHHFKELYTTHKGNFKLWLDQTDSYLMWISRNIFHEGPISTLEVLSELPNAMPPPPPPPSAQLPPKDSYVTLDENFLPHFPSWMVSQRQIDAQMELLSPTEAPSQEKTSRSEARPEEREREMTTVAVPLVEDTKAKPGYLTIQREDSLNSEEEKPSPGSSFEYTVLDTCDGLLFPRTRSIPPREPLKYAYLLMSELGEESPPPSPNIYQNSICPQLPAHIYSQC
ncbi:erythropoietin receptor isoform 1-T1 [Leptodactylus fuscus]|uniref:erythropoietin receptor n=1 Tax=Leptodactylus fuscus TaxID=238119 RepID=UPI003F4EC73E